MRLTLATNTLIPTPNALTSTQLAPVRTLNALMLLLSRVVLLLLNETVEAVGGLGLKSHHREAFVDRLYGLVVG
jgi:hypothetical protein